MVAILGGGLALVLGLAILLVPLLATELSRPRDSAWGAVMLLLGLVLLSSRDRLSGAPMLGVLCGGLLIGRLAGEVGQGRWRQLTQEEQDRLGSKERWSTSLQQLGATSAGLMGALATATQGLASGLGSGKPAKPTTKRWVRPDTPETKELPDKRSTPVVSSLAEVEALINPGDPDPTSPNPAPNQPSGIIPD
jgi:hypothetical protein